MPIVEVRDLTKTFSVKRKEAGLRGSLRSIVRPDFHPVEAVKRIRFSLEPGELLAFIGPNGAGKSTTIKMLTGILYPTHGEAQVLGLTPWRDRRKLAYRIGSVFVMTFTFFHSLTFWLGNAAGLAEQAMNAMLTFAMYPSDIFQGAVRFMLFTILPAAFVGLVPLNIVRGLDLNGLALLAAAAIFITLVSSATFYTGLRRYESGSAINVNV